MAEPPDTDPNEWFWGPERDAYEADLKALGLRPYTWHCLVRGATYDGGPRSVAELARTPDPVLMALPLVGPKSVAEIRSAVPYRHGTRCPRCGGTGVVPLDASRAADHAGPAGAAPGPAADQG